MQRTLLHRVTVFAFSLLMLISWIVCWPAVGMSKDQAHAADLTDLSLEDLMNVEITSAAKKSQKLSEATSAIFVITQQDLKRSGVTTIPDALRMVPGLHVARIDSNKWAITARGFTGRFSGLLLVLQDGRTLYEPTFSGTFWEIQDTLLEDVERIEVIRGPGAALWGANAVNGVINIITRSAAETQGSLISGVVGSELQGLIGLRHGTMLGDNTALRVYAKAFEHDAALDADGNTGDDNWRMLRGGFRSDWSPASEKTLTLQGDAYRGKVGGRNLLSTETPPDFISKSTQEFDLSGANLIGRWTNQPTPSSEAMLQAYIDYTNREELIASQQRTTLDIEFQHRFTPLKTHELMWGIGYRLSADRFKGSDNFRLDPANRSDSIFSGFIQDEIALWADKLNLTIGSKFEHNDYSGFEVQPTARLLATPNDKNSFWLAVSRAIRTPSRFEVDSDRIERTVSVQLPGSPSETPVRISLAANTDLDPIEMIALEGGYRTAPLDIFELDLALFYNQYEKLLTVETVAADINSTPITALVKFDNKMKGSGHGAELTAIFNPSPNWLMTIGYTYLDVDVTLDADSTDVLTATVNGSSPQHQVSMRTHAKLHPDLTCDLWLRYIDEVESAEIDSYITLDARLAWQLSSGIELALVGQNLLSGPHFEFTDEYFLVEATRVQPAVYAKLTWQF